MRPQRSIPLAPGALAAALLACGAGPPPPSKPRPLRSMVVGDAEGLERRRFPGRAQATQELNLAFEVAGRMIERPVMVGSEVQQGDVLAVLDPRDFQNALDRSVAERDRSKAFYERVAQAARTGAVSQQEVTDAEARMRRAEATLRINQKALDDSVLVAPFAGTISATYVENFQQVRAKQAVLRLLDTSRLEMEINIPENLISMSPFVKHVWLCFDQYPGREFPAEVLEVSNEASQATRTFPVTLVFDPPEDVVIKPGMAGAGCRAEIDLPDDLRVSGIEVPASAILTDDSQQSQTTYVWLVDEASSTVSRVPVEKVRLSTRGVQVRGLEVGQRIATAGVHYLREGQQVRIVE